MRTVAISSLITRWPFNALFPIKPEVLAAITTSIEEHGFYEARPIDVWWKKNVVVDGHTRLQAAIAVGLTEVPIFEHDFGDEDEALEFAIRNQRDRRNITNADILQCVATLDLRGPHGGVRPGAGRPSQEIKTSREVLISDGESESAVRQTGGEDPSLTHVGNSAKKMGELIGVSRATVERTRVVNDSGNEELIEDVKSNKKSINKAAREVIEQKKAAEQPAKVYDATTQAHVPGARYTTVIINAMGRSRVELEQLPLADLLQKEAYIYFVVRHDNLGVAYELLGEWGFEIQVVFAVGRRDDVVNKYFAAPVDFVVFAKRGDWTARLPIEAGYIVPDKSGLRPEAFYRVVLTTTAGKYLEIYPVAYRESLSVWGEETKMAEGVAIESQETPEEARTVQQRVERIMSDGVWRTVKEITQMIDGRETTVQRILNNELKGRVERMGSKSSYKYRGLVNG